MGAERLALRSAFTRSKPFNISRKNDPLDTHSEKQLGGEAQKVKLTHLQPGFPWHHEQ